MVVDPTTPRAEVVRTTLLGDTLERPNTDAVMERNGDGTLFAGFRMCVFETRVITACPVVPVAELSKHGDNLTA